MVAQGEEGGDDSINNSTVPQRPSEANAPHNDIDGADVAGIIVGLVVFAVIAGYISWFIYSRLRARRLGTSPPGLNPFADSNRIPGSGSGGVVGWIQDKFTSASRQRTAGGAYEGTTLGGLGDGAGRRNTRGRRGFGGLDPDEAWDSRVGAEADAYDGYEEQELSLRTMPPRHGDGENGYGGARSGSRNHQQSELDERYHEEIHGDSKGFRGARGYGDRNHDPFADSAALRDDESSRLRSVSPRPDRTGGEQRDSVDSAGRTRRSAFREAV